MAAERQDWASHDAASAKGPTVLRFEGMSLMGLLPDLSCAPRDHLLVRTVAIGVVADRAYPCCSH